MDCLWFLTISLVILTVESDVTDVSWINNHSVAVENTKEDTLILLHVLFRHGDRSPQLKEVYPKYPRTKMGFDGVGFGHLTKVGKQREYLIGKTLRNRYDKFLGSYIPEEVNAASTTYVRTKMSCLLVLAGLYPPSKEELWDNKTLWQPIPCEAVPKDKVIRDPLHHCKFFKNSYASFLSSKEAIDLYEANKQVYDYISEHTGWDIKSPNNVYLLYFFLQTMESMGIELPKWTEHLWPKKISTLAIDFYYVVTRSLKLNRIVPGYFIQKLVKDTERKIRSKTLHRPKIFLYSAHDYNIALLLKALGVFEPHIPPCGAYVTFEVHKINDVYCFKILYQDYKASPTKPKVLKLSGCNVFCPIEQFKQLVDKYIPEANECEG